MMKKEMRSRGIKFTDEEFEVFAESDQGKAQLSKIMSSLRKRVDEWIDKVREQAPII